VPGKPEAKTQKARPPDFGLNRIFSGLGRDGAGFKQAFLGGLGLKTSLFVFNYSSQVIIISKHLWPPLIISL
jgi:hypothetical protein